MKKIAIIPGKFKPPHIGHVSLIKELLKDKSIDKIYIIISRKPKPLINNKNEITAKESVDIWNIYLNKLERDDTNAKIKERVKVLISSDFSPLITAKKLAKKELKKGDSLILVKSLKNITNTRFGMFKDLVGIKITYPVIKTYQVDKKNISSTNMRRSIYNGDKKSFYEFLPRNISNANKNKIWNLVKI